MSQSPLTIAVREELVFTPSSDLAKPINIASKALVEYAATAIERSSVVSCTTEEEFNLAASFLNEMSKARTAIKNKALDFGRPFRDEAARITAEANKIIVPLAEAEARVDKEMSAYKRREADARAKALAEKTRLEAEARQRQQEAEKALLKAKTEGKFEEAAKKFDEAQKVAELAQQQTATVIAAPVKAAGVRETKRAVIVSYDLAKLPTVYHMIDEVKVKKSILMGLITEETPGIKFIIETGFSGSGR